jgi:hypothetical protein
MAWRSTAQAPCTSPTVGRSVRCRCHWSSCVHATCSSRLPCVTYWLMGTWWAGGTTLASPKGSVFCIRCVRACCAADGLLGARFSRACLPLHTLRIVLVRYIVQPPLFGNARSSARRRDVPFLVTISIRLTSTLWLATCLLVPTEGCCSRWPCNAWRTRQAWLCLRTRRPYTCARQWPTASYASCKNRLASFTSVCFTNSAAAWGAQTMHA